MATARTDIGLEEGLDRNDLAPVKAASLDPAPTRYVLRELTMTFDGGLKFQYRDPGLAQPLPEGQIAAVLEALTGPPAAAATFSAAAAGAEVDTPLDLRIYGDPIYVVLRLDPALNWRFSSDYPAVSLKDASVAGHYGGLRHVAADGTAQAEPFLGCKLVYFAATPPQLGAEDEYSHGFNFHVELTGTGTNGRSEVLPIIIDPEVGYPGGSDT